MNATEYGGGCTCSSGRCCSRSMTSSRCMCARPNLSLVSPVQLMCSNGSGFSREFDCLECRVRAGAVSALVVGATSSRSSMCALEALSFCSITMHESPVREPSSLVSSLSLSCTMTWTELMLGSSLHRFRLPHVFAGPV